MGGACSNSVVLVTMTTKMFYSIQKPLRASQCVFVSLLPYLRLLNANKINCLRVDAFQDLHNLNLLSLYDNKLQTIAKGTFSSLRAIQTL